MMIHNRPAVVALGLAMALGAAPARAALVTNILASVTPQSGGVSLYTYTVTDLPTSTSSISEFDLDVSGGQIPMGIITPTGALLSNITMPTGFINLYTTGDPSISFLSTDPSTDIAPGTSGIFSFTSPSRAVLQAYQFSTFDGTGSTTGGRVLSPTPLAAPSVPEPNGLLLLALGVPALALLAVRRRGLPHISRP